MTSKFSLCFITASGTAEAKKIAHKLVQTKSIACCNIVPSVTSIYEWNNKVEEDEESLLICKTVSSNQQQIIDQVKALHSYDCPEVLFSPVENGSNAYLDWVQKQTATAQKKGVEALLKEEGEKEKEEEEKKEEEGEEKK